MAGPEPAFQIRRVAPADVPTVLELYVELDAPHVAAHPDLYRDGVAPSRSAASVERALGDPEQAMFVGCFGDSIAGLVRVIDVTTPDGGVLAPRRFALVDELVVTHTARRTGLASRLLSAAEDWARLRAIGALEVTVWAFNDGALSLYRQQGYDPLRHYLRKPLQ